MFRPLLRFLLLSVLLTACGFAQTGFTTHSIALPGQQTRLTVADFNRDGRPDILVSGGLHAAILFNLGGGKFSAPVTLDTALFNERVAVGDFNGTGGPDIVGCGADSIENAHLRVYLNNGSGHFTISTNAPVNQSECSWLVVGDVNHDGKLDLVTGALKTRFGDGAGHFTSSVTQAINVNPKQHPGITGCFPASVIGAHFVTSVSFSLLIAGTCNNPPGQPTIDYGTIYLAQSQNNGHWTLSEIREQDVTWQFSGNAIDVNRDGLPDALLVHRLNAINNTQLVYGLDYLRNSGGGAFTYATVFSENATSTPDRTFVISGTAGDFDLDGSPNFAAGYELNTANNIALIDDASGRFSTTQHFAVPGNVFSMVSADFNRDGKPDFAAIAINPNNFTATLLVFTRN